MLTTHNERFFKWIRLLLDVQEESFNSLIKVKIEPSSIAAMRSLRLVIGGEISWLLESRETEPAYLSGLADFLSAKGRRKVFSLNYDCCLEDACRAAGIDLTTGFDPGSMRWTPSLLQSEANGINLYKLHGSLRWFAVPDNRASGEEFDPGYELIELQPGLRPHIPAQLSLRQEPELVLGPGDKVQLDDPFLTLLYAFHRSIQRARICVVIGYGYGDRHINDILFHAIRRGLFIIDVSPSQINGGDLLNKTDRWPPIKLPAKKALESGRIRTEVDSLKT